MKNRNRLRIPWEYRHHIDPDVRIKVFKEIAKGYVDRYDFKCIYAFLNTDPDFLIDYTLIFKARNDENSGDLILYDTVPINSDRCTPHYVYYKESGNLDKFFQFGAEEMVTMIPKRFYEFLQVHCELSRNKKDENYWKNPSCAKELTDEMLHLSLGYNRNKIPIPMEDTRKGVR